MSVLLALISAVFFGAGDFFGGVAARRTSASVVVVCSQIAGLVILIPALFFIPSAFAVSSILWGAAAGLASGFALLLFYRSLSVGSMSVVAPLTALVSAAVPVLVGLLLGERVSPVAFVGMGFALVAAVLVAAEGGRLPTLRQLIGSRATGGALAAGALFGLFLVLISRPSPGSGLWPLAGARAVSIALILVLALIRRQSIRPARASILPIVLTGVGDTGANVLFLLSARLGLLIITTVLIALYPAVTVVLARARFGERATHLQLVGLAAAALAVVLIAVG